MHSCTVELVLPSPEDGELLVLKLDEVSLHLESGREAPGVDPGTCHPVLVPGPVLLVPVPGLVLLVPAPGLVPLLAPVLGLVLLVPVLGLVLLVPLPAVGLRLVPVVLLAEGSRALTGWGSASRGGPGAGLVLVLGQDLPQLLGLLLSQEGKRVDLGGLRHDVNLHS